MRQKGAEVPIFPSKTQHPPCLTSFQQAPPLKSSTTFQQGHTGDQAFNTRVFGGHSRSKVWQPVYAPGTNNGTISSTLNNHNTNDNDYFSLIQNICQILARGSGYQNPVTISYHCHSLEEKVSLIISTEMSHFVLSYTILPSNLLTRAGNTWRPVLMITSIAFHKWMVPL